MAEPIAIATMTRKQATDEFAVKSAELEVTLNKGDDLTPADLDTAKATSERCKALKVHVLSFDQIDTLRADGKAFKSFATTPTRPPFSGSDGDNSNVPRVEAIGAVKAGDCLIDRQTKAVIMDKGPGHFGQKAWDAITSPEYAETFWDNIRGKAGPVAVKDLQLGLDETAGFLAPAEFIARVISRKAAPTSMIGRVNRFAISRDKVTLPRVQYSADDLYTTGFRVTKTGELPASSTAAAVNDANLVGVFKVDVDTWMIRAVVTNDMIEDAAFPLEQWLADKFRETIDLLYEDQITNANGKLAPDGIFNRIGDADKPEVVLSGAAAALSHDGLIDLITALAPQYDENAAMFMAKKGGYRALNKLKDTQGRPLFTTGYNDSGLTPGRQMQLLGYPVVFNQFMSQTVSATTYPILFGDVRGYYHVDRIGFSIQVLRELYAETNRLVLLGRVRFGGGVAEPWKMKIQKSNNS